VQTARNGLADHARFVAALAVMWASLDLPGDWIAEIGLPLFIVLTVAQSRPQIGDASWRFLRPFVIWSAVYALVNLALGAKYGESAFGWWRPEMLVMGTSPHLWVLPFLFLVVVLSPWFRHPLASLGVALLVATLLVNDRLSSTPPLPQWSFALIPVMTGIGFMAWGWRLAATTLVCSWLVLQLGRPDPDNFSILAGTAIALIILSYRTQTTPASLWCGRLAMGIYLAFPIAILIGYALRISWVELGLFSVVGSVILAQIADTAAAPSARRS